MSLGWAAIICQRAEYRIDGAGCAADVIAVDAVNETAAAIVFSDQVKALRRKRSRAVRIY